MLNMIDNQSLIDTVNYCISSLEEDKQSIEHILKHLDRYEWLDKDNVLKEHADICLHQERLVFILDNIINGKLNG